MLAWLRNFYTISQHLTSETDGPLVREGGLPEGGLPEGGLPEAPAAAVRRTTSILEGLRRAVRRVPWAALWAQVKEHNLYVKLLSLGSSIVTCIILFVLGIILIPSNPPKVISS